MPIDSPNGRCFNLAIRGRASDLRSIRLTAAATFPRKSIVKSWRAELGENAAPRYGYYNRRHQRPLTSVFFPSSPSLLSLFSWRSCARSLAMPDTRIPSHFRRAGSPSLRDTRHRRLLRLLARSLTRKFIRA